MSAEAPSHKFTRFFTTLGALLRNFSRAITKRDRASGPPVRSRVRGCLCEGQAGTPAYALSFHEASKTPELRRRRFAGRNETFRIPRRKPLESLRELNRRFRGTVCFQGANCLFVSRFSLMRRLSTKGTGARIANCSIWAPSAPTGRVAPRFWIGIVLDIRISALTQLAMIADIPVGRKLLF